MFEKFKLISPALKKDQIKKHSPKEINIQKKVKTSIKTGRLAVNPKQKTVLIKGILLAVEVPFIGDRRVFYYQPSRKLADFPKGTIEDHIIKINYRYEKDDQVPEDLRIKHDLDRIEYYLKAINDDLSQYNSTLKDEILAMIKAKQIKKAK